MLFRDPLPLVSVHPARFKHGVLAALLLLGACAYAPFAIAQQSASPALPATTAATSAWASLTPSQHQALAPLEHSWAGLSEGQKRKWLEIAKSYPNLGQAEQAKLHSRMVEWAAMSPKDRELARLNFAQSKTLNQTDRAANWEAYQALSPAEKQKLLDSAKPKPVGATVPVKPVDSGKLATVPVTRHTPESERAAAVSQRPLNRVTLLPQQPPAGATDSGAASNAASKP